MRVLAALFSSIIVTIAIFFPSIASAENINIPILCYHNLNPVKPGSMNMTPKKFESQMKWLLDNGFTIIPLQEAVEYLQGKRSSLPHKAIVVTADDGWKSVYDYMYPVVKKYRFPVTLFIYPQTISEGKNAMTWDELKTLQQTGLFDIQSHTYDHPNFKIMKRHLSTEKFESYVNMQMVKSKSILEEKMGKKITLLAWPFGIYNDYLEQQAAKAGYIMAFTIDYKPANKKYRPMAQPRFMMIDALAEKTVHGIANDANS